MVCSRVVLHVHRLVFKSTLVCATSSFRSDLEAAEPPWQDESKAVPMSAVAGPERRECAGAPVLLPPGGGRGAGRGWQPECASLRWAPTLGMGSSRRPSRTGVCSAHPHLAYPIEFTPS